MSIFCSLPVVSGTTSPASAKRADLQNLLAEEGLAPKHHLEAVVVGGIVGPGDHDGAVGLLGGGGVVEHRRRPAADPQCLDPAGLQAVDQRLFKFRAGQPAIVADRDPLAAALGNDRAENPSDGKGIGRVQGAPDDAADVVFAQNGRVEAVREGHGPDHSNYGQTYFFRKA